MHIPQHCALSHILVAVGCRHIAGDACMSLNGSSVRLVMRLKLHVYWRSQKGSLNSSLHLCTVISTAEGFSTSSCKYEVVSLSSKLMVLLQGTWVLCIWVIWNDLLNTEMQPLDSFTLKTACQTMRLFRETHPLLHVFWTSLLCSIFMFWGFEWHCIRLSVFVSRQITETI